jgi:hypothetical protein
MFRVQGSPIKSVPVKQNKKQVSQDKLRFFSSKNLKGQAGLRVQGSGLGGKLNP